MEAVQQYFDGICADGATMIGPRISSKRYSINIDMVWKLYQKNKTQVTHENPPKVTECGGAKGKKKLSEFSSFSMGKSFQSFF